MTTRRLSGWLLAAALLGLAPAAADTLVDGRFVSKTGDFSIDMHRAQDQAFHLDKEKSDAGVSLADFRFSPGATFWGLTAIRTVEWFKLDKPVAPEESDGAAQGLVDGYFAARYPGAKFEIVARRKARTDAGRLYYVFEAKGVLSNTDTTWRGVVIMFDAAIGVVAQVANADARKAGLDNWFDEGPFVSWATTLRPEK